jgi:Rhodopirellula transposase DDE domain
VPCGIGEAGHGALRSTLGRAYKTSDFLVETLAARWHALAAATQATTAVLQITLENGPERSGSRTPLLQRMVQGVDDIGQTVPWLYSPPSPSK